ncbi:MAG TPA: hypothetical protein VNR11_18220 [Xanthobacteraceae bacterium]|nr:hypothetical protein [Xanthobacteraceae bacterium]
MAMKRRSRIRKTDPEGDAVAMKLLGHHLPYEVNMFRALYSYVSQPSPSRLVRNAFIESFHLHARVIMEFLKDDRLCVVDPRRYTTSAFLVNGDFIPRKLEAKINQQIAHLTRERTDDEKYKLSDHEREQTFQVIQKELARWERELTPECRAVWEQGLREMQVDDGYGSIVAPEHGGATNVVESISSQGGTSAISSVIVVPSVTGNG